MTRNNSVNFTGPLQYPIADAATDLFKKEDVQVATKALDLHDHTNGKGLPIPAAAIPNGTITSAMIADGTIVAGDIADGAITSAKILDGTIATADHANASITNALLAADTARLNLLTNGGFEIWQRGSNFSSNGQCTADRWYLSLTGSDTINVARNTTVDRFGVASVGVSFTLGSGGGSSNLFQPLEPNSLTGGMTVTFSVRVNQNVANAVHVAIADSLGRTSGSTVATTGSWVTLSVTRTLAPTPTLVYAEIHFDATVNPLYLDNAMVVVGSQAADFAPLHPADDLARCLRYYETLNPPGNGNKYELMGQATAATQAYAIWRWKTQKAVAPTITILNATNFTLLNGSGSSNIACTSAGNVDASLFHSFLQFNVASGLVAGNATIVHSGAAGQITAEAN